MPCKTQAISVGSFIRRSVRPSVCLFVHPSFSRCSEGLGGPQKTCRTRGYFHMSNYQSILPSEGLWGLLRFSKAFPVPPRPFLALLRLPEDLRGSEAPLSSSMGYLRSSEALRAPLSTLGETDGQTNIQMGRWTYGRTYRNLEITVSYRTSFKRNMNGAIVILLWFWAIFCHFPNNLFNSRSL